METGILRDDTQVAPLAPRWDKRPAVDPVDLGDIGEDQGGVWVAVHPLTLLSESPNLWGPFCRWRHGIRDLTLSDLRSLTAFDARCHVTMLAASTRAMKRPSREEAEE